MDQASSKRESIRKMEKDFLRRPVVTRNKDLKLEKERFSLDLRKNCFCNEGGETLEQVTHRKHGCLIIGSVQSQVRQGFEQPEKLIDVPDHGRGFQQNDFQSLFQPKQI